MSYLSLSLISWGFRESKSYFRNGSRVEWITTTMTATKDKASNLIAECSSDATTACKGMVSTYAMKTNKYSALFQLLLYLRFKGQLVSGQGTQDINKFALRWIRTGSLFFHVSQPLTTSDMSATTRLVRAKGGVTPLFSGAGTMVFIPIKVPVSVPVVPWCRHQHRYRHHQHMKGINFAVCSYV